MASKGATARRQGDLGELIKGAMMLNGWQNILLQSVLEQLKGRSQGTGRIRKTRSSSRRSGGK